MDHRNNAGMSLLRSVVGYIKHVNTIWAMLTRLEMQFSMREDMNVKLASTKVGLNSLCP